MNTVATDSGFDPATVRVGGAEHFIGGRRVAGPPEIEVRRPSDLAVYAAVPDAGAAGVDQAVNAAQQALRESGWSRGAPRDRARILRRWADLIEGDAAFLAPLDALGSTRPVRDVRQWDIPHTAECVRFYAELADKHGGQVAATRQDHLGLILTEPYGIVGAITAWNFPLTMVAWKAAPALAAGNAVILKPSELTPFTALRLAELAVQAGLPPGLLNIVNGKGPTTGDALSAHPGIAKISFTGSNATGKAIMVRCAEQGPKPVTLELGGKSPQVIFGDLPDIARTASVVARAILGNAGQVCNAGSRLIVEQSIVDEIVDWIRRLCQQVRPGATWHGTTDFSPIVSQRQADRVHDLVQRSVSAGAHALIGANRLDCGLPGKFYAPTILQGVRADMPAVREEIFGPVMTVQTFRDEEEAYALANDTVYGLTAGVHTGSVDRALRAVRRIEAGSIWVNRYGRSGDFVLPTGGFKGSGIGKDLGVEAFQANLRQKVALIDFGGP